MNPLYRSTVDLDWVTFLLTASLVLLCVMNYFFRAAFLNFLILPFTNKYVSLRRKKGKILEVFHIMMSIIQILNLTLFVFIIENIRKENELGVYNELFFLIAFCLIGYFILKILIQIANGYFFGNMELMTELIFEKLTYFNYGGFIAFIGNVLLVYVFPQYKPIIYVMLILIIAINGIGIVRMIRNHQKLIIANIFYFILYICTLEISPITLIISYLNSYSV